MGVGVNVSRAQGVVRDLIFRVGEGRGVGGVLSTGFERRGVGVGLLREGEIRAGC